MPTEIQTPRDKQLAAARQGRKGAPRLGSSGWSSASSKGSERRPVFSVNQREFTRTPVPSPKRAKKVIEMVELSVESRRRAVWRITKSFPLNAVAHPREVAAVILRLETGKTDLREHLVAHTLSCGEDGTEVELRFLERTIRDEMGRLLKKACEAFDDGAPPSDRRPKCGWRRQPQRMPDVRFCIVDGHECTMVAICRLLHQVLPLQDRQKVCCDCALHRSRRHLLAALRDRGAFDEGAPRKAGLRKTA